jgi:anti-sigma B factor antagonist
MFEIKIDKDGRIILSGRFDAAQVDKAREVFDSLNKSTVIDLAALAYISSGGLSVLLGTEKRLRQAGGRLKLRNMNSHIRELFKYAGLDMVFDIE